MGEDAASIGLNFASAGIYPPALPGSFHSPCVLLWLRKHRSTNESQGVTTVPNHTLQVCGLRMPQDAGEPGNLGTWPPLHDPRAARWLPPAWDVHVRLQGLCLLLLPERLFIRRHLASHRFDALPGTNYFSDACRLPVPSKCQLFTADQK